jgi:hypothetical protein
MDLICFQISRQAVQRYGTEAPDSIREQGKGNNSKIRRFALPVTVAETQREQTYITS